MGFNIGGGGGRAPGLTANNRFNLAKPYDLEGEMTPEKMSNLDEMLQMLFQGMQQGFNTLLDSDGEATGTGDVVGPSSSTDDNIPMFDGTTGKLLADSGIAKSSLVASDSNGNVLKTITDISAAQFATIRATPIQIVAAPGAGKILIWLGSFCTVNADVAWNATVTLTIGYSTTPAGIGSTLGSVIATGATGLRHIHSIGTTATSTTTDRANTAIYVQKSTAGESTGGSFVNDIMRIVTFYSIMNAPY